MLDKTYGRYFSYHFPTKHHAILDMFSVFQIPEISDFSLHVKQWSVFYHYVQWKKLCVQWNKSMSRFDILQENYMIIGMQENNAHERGKGEGGSKSMSPQPPCNAVSLVSRQFFLFSSSLWSIYLDFLAK